jgi:hypothetical protein
MGCRVVTATSPFTLYGSPPAAWGEVVFDSNKFSGVAKIPAIEKRADRASNLWFSSNMRVDTKQDVVDTSLSFFHSPTPVRLVLVHWEEVVFDYSNNKAASSTIF